MNTIQYVIAYEEHMDFLIICANGTPLKVIKELKKAGLDRAILEVEVDEMYVLSDDEEEEQYDED